MQWKPITGRVKDPGEDAGAAECGEKWEAT
jgi:hypothetical protein